MFNRSDTSGYAGTIIGTGTLTQAGTGTTTLAGAGSSVASANVTAGTLNLAQSGAFTATGNYTTGNGAATQIANNATLAVGGSLTQAAGSTLNVAIGSTQPIISATSANLAGTLNITGFTAPTPPDSASALGGNQFNVIHTSGGITNDFTSVTVGGAASPVDYLTVVGGKSANGLDYNVGLGLTWFAGATQGNGAFTLANSSDAFNVDAALSNQPVSSAPWNGTTLTKNGAGTLTLSAANTYTGGTVINAGTLQIGNGGTSGSIVGDVTDNGILALNRSDAITYGGVVSGTGALTQAGSGTTILTGANTYAGGTNLNAGILNVSADTNLGATTGGLTFNGGTLQTAGSFTSARAVTLNASGTIDTQANINALTGVIAGVGAFSKQGSGTLILAADNTYRGGTTINTGTLQLGNGGTSGSIVGDVTDNGVLAVIRSDAFSYGGVVSGTGALTQAGAGSTILTGNNTYSGGTTISSGTLQLGNGGTSGSLVGDVTDNGALVFNRTDNQTFNGIISGSGSLTQTGSGSVLFNGVQTYSGATNIIAGTLAIGDATHTGAELAGGGQVTVGAAGSLGGYGKVTGSVINQGLIGVGNALPLLANGPDATFTIVGNLNNQGTISMDNGVAGDRMIVTGGTYTSNGGRLLIDTVLNEGGANSQTDMLVTASTAVGAGGATRITVQQIAGSGALTSVNGIEVVSVANANQSASGAFSLDGRVAAGPYEYRLFQGGVSDPSDGQWYLRSEKTGPGPIPTPIPQKLLRPEAGAYLGNQYAAQTMFLSTLHDRMGEPQSATDGQTDSNINPAAGWARIGGANVRGDGAGGQLGVKTQGELIQAGGDVAQWSAIQSGDRLHLGLMTSYGSMRTNASADGNPYGAHGTVDGYAIGAYATWFANEKSKLGAYVDGWVQYGNFSNQVDGDLLPGEKYNSHSWTTSLEAGYSAKPFGNDWVIEPQGQLIYIDSSAANHTEVNGTVVMANSTGGVMTRLGARLYKDFVGSDGNVLQASVTANWWYSNRENTIGMDGVTVPLDGAPKSTGEIKAGLQYRLTRNWQTWGNLGWGFGSDNYQRLTGMAGVKYAW